MIGGALRDLVQRQIQRLRGRTPDVGLEWDDPYRGEAIDGTGRRVIDRGRDRLIIAGALFGLCFMVLGLRLVDLAVFGSGDAQASVNRRATTTVTERADIVDRNDMLLATALDTASLYADASKVLDPAVAARELAGVLPGLNEKDLLAKLETRRSFIWIRRNLTPEQEYAVNNLGLPGLSFQREPKRIYPHGRLAAHVLGFVDVDNHGLAGVEAFFDERLRTPEPNARLALSIDLRVQHALTEELANAIQTYGGIGGAGLVMDVRTGEVLGMASLPDFDPNYPGTAQPESRFNRVTLGVYEMGSTFKTFTTAMALDEGIVGLKGGFDASHPIKIGRFTISDDHPQARWLSVPEIFMYSSNIGSVRMALAAGTNAQREFLDRFGLLRRSSLELPEQGAPLVPHPWREINTMTIAFGHGLSVTPLQLATAFSAVVNGGVLLPPTLVRVDPDHPPAGVRVISSETSNTMRRLLRLVVERGTGRRGEALGYYVGGKTGTAEKSGGGGYRRNATLSSFLAAFPMQEPRFAVLIMIDEPKGNAETHGFRTGGWVAAPAVSRIVTRIAPLMGVPPVPEGEQTLQAAQLVSSTP